jgi:hypothetical protein
MANAKLQDVITIKKIGEKENKFWIQDTNGEFYSSFKTYEGNNNQEYNQLLFGNHNEPFQEGDTVVVTYTKTVGANDKIYKNLKSIFPVTNGFGVPNSSQPQEEPRGEAPSASQTTSRNWDREAYEKCCSIWAAALMDKEGHSMSISLIEQGYFYDLFQAIRQSGYEKFEAKTGEVVGKSATDSSKAAFDRGMARAQELPTIQQDDDINVEDIPF